MKTFKDVALDYFKEYGRDLPWRHNRTPYTVMLSEFLLDRTTVKQALPYYKAFLDSYPTLHDLAQAPESDVLKKWAGLGFYSRAKYLLASAQIIDLNGDFPTNFETWRALPGVGDYMASSISSILHQDHYVAFDGNLKRVLSRIYERDTNRKEQQAFIQNDVALDNEHSGDFNECLMDIGATVCLKEPLCPQCPFKEYCLAYQHGTINDYPLKAKALKKKEEYFISILFKEKNRVILRQRSESLLHNFLESRNYLIDEKRASRDINELIKSLGLSLDIKNYHIIDKGTSKQVFSHKTWFFHGYVIETPLDQMALLDHEAIYDLNTLDTQLISMGQKFLFEDII